MLWGFEADMTEQQNLRETIAYNNTVIDQYEQRVDEETRENLPILCSDLRILKEKYLDRAKIIQEARDKVNESLKRFLVFDRGY